MLMAISWLCSGSPDDCIEKVKPAHNNPQAGHWQIAADPATIKIHQSGT
jgi:hypothetical protein